MLLQPQVVGCFLPGMVAPAGRNGDGISRGVWTPIQSPELLVIAASRGSTIASRIGTRKSPITYISVASVVRGDCGPFLSAWTEATKTRSRHTRRKSDRGTPTHTLQPNITLPEQMSNVARCFAALQVRLELLLPSLRAFETTTFSTG
jgi:hypothetical protein